MEQNNNLHKQDMAGGIAHAFIDSKLTPLIVLASLLLGLFAVLMTPREEEPQIKVPMVDIFVQMPGASAREVEERVTKPMEKLLWEIPGVEYVYTTSSASGMMAIVRFKVGHGEEDAAVKVYTKMYSNFDRIPPTVSKPLIKLRTIDDVPILALTFWGGGYDSFDLRRVASKVSWQIKNIPDVAEIRIIGGERRQIRVLLDPDRLAAHRLAPAMVMPVLEAANQALPSGDFAEGNALNAVEAGKFFTTIRDVENVVVGVSPQGGPVYLRNVAAIKDGPEETTNYVSFANGAAAAHGESAKDSNSAIYPAVTISVAKRKGTNASVLSDKILHKVEGLKGGVVPPGINVSVTRNYGETAKEKSNELLFHMALATVSVFILIVLFLGFRGGLVVGIAVPVTLALTLFTFYILGFTLNRITLFALIFCIGILVDDAIVILENIVRHFALPENHGRPRFQVAVEAVAEVGNPTILATFTVIAAILPMAFVRGLMGPYMRPIPVGATAAMLFSLLIAFIISPWASVRLLKPGAHGHGEDESPDDWFTRFYRRFMDPMIHNARRRWAFILFVGVLLLGSCAMVGVRMVKVKMLPFDNKSEFQVIIDMPEGSTLEQTETVTRRIGDYLRTVPEVENIQLYSGTASPFNFNGLVRHYFLRSGANVADIQVNLTPKHHRKRQSHAIAKSVRDRVHEIARPYGANVKISEVPPGPPVLQTLVAEVYGPDYDRQIEIARKIQGVFESTDGVVDVDTYIEDEQTKYTLEVDSEKAALNGVSVEQAARTLRMALAGVDAGILHDPEEEEDVLVNLRFPLSKRSDLESIKNVKLISATGALVPLREVVAEKKSVIDKSIYHKNLMPVVYVTADVGGEAESPVYAILAMKKKIDAMKLPEGYTLKQHTAALPAASDRFAMKWDGEWHITYEVFRDLGLAFAFVLILIYILVVAWFQDFVTPLVIMAPIPVTLIGILPAHWAMGAYFTATSMIGFIAGAGIIVRNSIILVDFIELRVKQGMPFDRAVIDAGAVRFRPMLLTAAAVVVGASVILLDPIFQGLAIALMAGEVASTLLSRMLVPILYYMARRKVHMASDAQALAAEHDSGAATENDS
jgi:multidrug efflux pump subunit AcrB